jgi:hypothetical protein
MVQVPEFEGAEGRVLVAVAREVYRRRKTPLP